MKKGKAMKQKKIYFYMAREKYGEFSNFAPYGIEMDGRWWKTPEYYFQAQKFTGEAHKEKIANAVDTKTAFNLGRSREIPIREDWEEVKDKVMYRAILKKFKTYPKLKALLLSTGDAEIIENSPLDNYWACGKDGKGKNMLGQIFMRVRGELKI